METGNFLMIDTIIKSKLSILKRSPNGEILKIGIVKEKYRVNEFREEKFAGYGYSGISWSLQDFIMNWKNGSIIKENFLKDEDNLNLLKRIGLQ